MLDNRTQTAGRFDPQAAPAYRELSDSASDLFILAGRILVGQLFVVSGFGKITVVGVFAASLQKRGVPAPDVMALIGACVEFFGGLAVVLGFKTRWAATLMLIFTIVATAIGHRYWEFTDPAVRLVQYMNFYKNLTIAGGILFLIACGGGRLSIDGLLRRTPR